MIMKYFATHSYSLISISNTIILIKLLAINVLTRIITAARRLIVNNSEDDCEDCQKERAENNQLIDFYERLNKIKGKVSTTKKNLANHINKASIYQSDLNKISTQIQKPPVMDLQTIDQK